MSLTVKAFLEKNGKVDGEIRRFNIPGDVISSYAYLSKKVADIFPSVQEGKFSLYWRDPDGDLVLFSTDEEQMEALGFVTDSLFKIFIKVNNDKQEVPQSEEAQGELHAGVICDGCDGGIRGIRYKCMVCPDYDLCSVCEKKGIHQQHNMLKISHPDAQAPGCFWGLPPPPPPMGHRHGPHGHSRPGEPFAPPPHFRRWMRRFMKRWHNKNAPGCSHESKDDSPDDEDTTCDEEYLKSVGESVAAMLDPMGIDVHVDVEHGGKRHCRGAGQGRGRGRGRGNRNHAGCMFREESLKRKCPNKAKASEAEKDDSNSMETDKLGQPAETSVEAQKAQAQADAQKEVEVTEELREKTEKIVLDDEDQEVVLIKETEKQPNETAPKMNVQNGKDQVDSTWTFVPQPTTQPPPAAPVTQAGPSQAPPTQREVQFQMPPQVVYPPSSPRVAEALNQMMSMGFNNDGGWLTRLLESKDGDIIQVLDAIKPQPGRTQQTNGGYMA